MKNGLKDMAMLMYFVGVLVGVVIGIFLRPLTDWADDSLWLKLLVMAGACISILMVCGLLKKLFVAKMNAKNE